MIEVWYNYSGTNRINSSGDACHIPLPDARKDKFLMHPHDTSNAPALKVCTKCGESKPLSEFHKKIDGAFGRQPKCKLCVLAYQRARCLEHPERVKEINARSLSKRPPIDCAKHYAKYKYQNNSQKRQRYASDEAFREKCKAFARAWGKANPARRNQTNKVWQAANPQKVRLMRTRRLEKYRVKYRVLWVTCSALRRARHRAADGHFTVAQWRHVVAVYNHTCLCCGKTEPEIKLAADHVVPLVLGGSNDISNIQPLCGSCNSKKSDKHIDYRPRWGDTKGKLYVQLSLL